MSSAKVATPEFVDHWQQQRSPGLTQVYAGHQLQAAAATVSKEVTASGGVQRHKPADRHSLAWYVNALQVLVTNPIGLDPSGSGGLTDTYTQKLC
jgi:hypothetical protein